MTAAVVVVVGSLHLDLMVHGPSLPRLGETVVGRRWAMQPGGKGGNQAVAAAAHGAATAMVGLVGDDDFGRRLRDSLLAAGVDAAAVAVRPGEGSGMSVAILEAGGDYGAVIVSGVNRAIDAAVIAPTAPVIEGARWLLLQNEIPEAANLAAATLARAAGVKVLLNAAPARTLDPALAAQLDILVVNALEAEDLAGLPVTGLATAARAAAQLAASVPCVIVTAGGDGLAMVTDQQPAVTLPAHAITVASTHGAGDCFVGALAARLAAGEALPAAIAYANAAAAALVATPEAEREGFDPPAAAWRLLAAVTR